MNSYKKLLVAKSILAAAVIAASGASAPVIGQTAPRIVGNTLGTPADGVVCRVGYTADFGSGTALKCRKSSSVIINLSCDTPRFPQYLARAVTASRKGGNGEDICIQQNSNIGPTDLLDGLAESTNPNNGQWEFAKVNMTTVAAAVVTADQTEATSLGLPVTGVETLTSITFPQVNAQGIRDKSATQINHYVFAGPTGGLAGGQGPVGLPATASPTSTFVPRPLPR